MSETTLREELSAPITAGEQARRLLPRFKGLTGGTVPKEAWSEKTALTLIALIHPEQIKSKVPIKPYKLSKKTVDYLLRNAASEK